MKLNKSYSYNFIENWAHKNNYNIDEFGKERVGEHFLKLSHNEKDIVISFFMDGSTIDGYSYKCVYSDLN